MVNIWGNTKNEVKQYFKSFSVSALLLLLFWIISQIDTVTSLVSRFGRESIQEPSVSGPAVVFNGEVTINGQLTMGEKLSKTELISVRKISSAFINYNKYRIIVLLNTTGSIEGVNIRAKDTNIVIEETQFTEEELQKFKNASYSGTGEFYSIVFITNKNINVPELSFEVY